MRSILARTERPELLALVPAAGAMCLPRRQRPLPILHSAVGVAVGMWLAVVTPGSLEAQDGAPTSGAPPFVTADAPPGSHLEVSLMTIGPGDLVWERFSHNAIVIRDDRARTEVAYNWGIFDFNQVGFWPRLVRGRMLYSMRGYPASASLTAYRQANRAVWLNPVNLSPGERLELQALLKEMDTEANRYYRYDYYGDNCSTRLRDALDRVLGGQIRAATERIDTGTTYRWHAARLLQFAVAPYAGMQFLLGNRVDERISAWEEMFLPLRLKEHLEGVRIVNTEGEPTPLLGDAVQLFEAAPDSVPLTAPDFLFRMLLVGTAIGAIFAGLGWVAGEGKRWGRWALALSGAAWSTGVGLAGTVLLLSWFFTDHVFWAVNENAFQANPASLILAGVLIRAALNRNGLRANVWLGIRVDVVAKVVVGVAITGFLVQLLPGFDQVNGEVMAVLLPAHVGLAWGALRAWPPSMV